MTFTDATDPARDVPKDGVISEHAAAGRPHYPELDGLRGAAILGVLVGHIAEWTYGAGGLVTRCAECGVLLFFVLSGFLITDLLLREERARGSVDLKAFYLRRALRLLPAMFLYVGTIAALKLFGVLRHESWTSVGAALLYVRNHFGAGAALGHLWSLSLEEQFYVTWPALFLLARGQRLRLGLAILVGMTLWRGGAIALHLTKVWDGRVYHATWFRYDSIMYGCCLALAVAARPALLSGARLRWLRRPELGLGVVAAATAVSFGHALFPVRLTLQSLGMTWLLWSALTSRPPELQRTFLTWRPLGWLGTISYSLYLWQGLFIELPSPYFGETALAGLHSFPLNLALSLAAACASYYVVERPFLRLKRRFAR